MLVAQLVGTLLSSSFKDGDAGMVSSKYTRLNVTSSLRLSADYGHYGVKSIDFTP